MLSRCQLFTIGLLIVGISASTGGEGICKGDAPQHSGYLSAGSDAAYFYYLAESRSSTATTDPLILWMTGGPGCSSTLALLTENGPCKVDAQEGDTWQVSRNPWSWTEAANVVWVDQPVGVGFSSRGDSLVYTEKQVAARMFTFLQAFYRKFPHLLHVPFFIIGESYGGHYVPAVAARLLHEKDNGIGPLAGIAIGNGMVDPTVQFKSKPLMAYTGGEGGSLHGGVINESAFHQMEVDMAGCAKGIATCQQERDSTQCVMAYAGCVSPMLPVLQSGMNSYDLRQHCPPSTPSAPGSAPTGVQGMCYNFTKETEFLNDPQVKASLGVPAEHSWQMCNMTSIIPFVLSGDELLNYQPAVEELLAAGVHVLVYAGDTDFMVDWMGCRAWVEQLPWVHQKEWAAAPRTAFTVHNQSKGIEQTARGLTFLQIFNAGHMVPMDQPEVALAMVRKFLVEVSAQESSPEPIHFAVSPSVFGGFIAGGMFLFMVVASWRRQHAEPGYLLMT